MKVIEKMLVSIDSVFKNNWKILFLAYVIALFYWCFSVDDFGIDLEDPISKTALLLLITRFLISVALVIMKKIKSDSLSTFLVVLIMVGSAYIAFRIFLVYIGKIIFSNLISTTDCMQNNSGPTSKPTWFGSVKEVAITDYNDNHVSTGLISGGLASAVSEGWAKKIGDSALKSSFKGGRIGMLTVGVSAVLIKGTAKYLKDVG